MALWGKKEEELPEILRGKKPEEIVQALSDAEKIRTDKEAADAARAEAERKATEAQTALEQAQTKLRELEAGAGKQTTTPETSEPASPWIDPDKYVAEQTQGIKNTALMSGMLTAKMYFQQQLSQRDSKIFKKYEKEVDQTVGTFVPEQRVMPQSWFNAFLYVKGLHEGEISKAEREGSDFFSETPSRSVNEPPVAPDKLTAEEEMVCRTMHWDPKKYLEQKKNGAMAQSDKGAYAHFTIPERKRA